MNFLLQQPNVLLIELNMLLYQNIFVIPILTNDFVRIAKSFFLCSRFQDIGNLSCFIFMSDIASQVLIQFNFNAVFKVGKMHFGSKF